MEKISRSPVLKKARASSSVGFTLIELMVTIAIAAIFAALAVPSFRDFIAGQRVKTASYDISFMLTGARSEALKRNLNVIVTPSSGGWQSGWTITTGVDNTVIGQHEAFAGLTISGPATSLIYNSSGRLTAAVIPFNVSSTVGGNISSRCIGIDLSGLPNSKSGAC